MLSRTRSVIVAIALAATGGLAAASSAQAITYTFTNVPLTDGGVLNGNFTTNVYGAPATWNLTTSGGSLLPELYANPPNVINAIASPSFDAPTAIDFFSNAEGYFVELHLAFSGNIMNGGVTLLGGGQSFECHGWVCPSNDTRFIGPLKGDEVAISGTPLPAALPLMAGGLGLIALIMRGRKKEPRRVVTR
jgi:hypothetical protein